jgi:hypothetical protein
VFGRSLAIAAVLVGLAMSTPWMNQRAEAACVGLIDPGPFECDGGCEVDEAGVGFACSPGRGGIELCGVWTGTDGHIGCICVANLNDGCVLGPEEECVAIIRANDDTVLPFFCF